MPGGNGLATCCNEPIIASTGEKRYMLTRRLSKIELFQITRQSKDLGKKMLYDNADDANQ